MSNQWQLPDGFATAGRSTQLFDDGYRARRIVCAGRSRVTRQWSGYYSRNVSTPVLAFPLENFTQL
jgi:hypothetical protein